MVTAALLFLPYYAHAGVFSFMSELFGKTKEVAIENVENSQNMSLLQAALNSDPNPSKGGGEITIVGASALLPETGPSGTLADIEEHRSDAISIYVVREGDTLSKIAEVFDVSVNTIMWANEVRSDKSLQVGQTLVILPISGVRHTIKKGDTVESLAAKYKADVSEIIEYNNLKRGAPLAVGEVITIPDGEIVQPKSSSNMAKGRGLPAYAGYYMRPITGGHKSQGIHGFNGVDLAAPLGTPIYAAANGVVIISKIGGWNTGYGNYVVISHPNGTQTLYAHNSQNLVSPGQTVKQGDTIALMGSTGKSTGSHVHFEVRGARNPF